MTLRVPRTRLNLSKAAVSHLVRELAVGLGRTDGQVAASEVADVARGIGGDEVVDGIDRDTHGAIQFRFRTVNNADWRHIAAGVAAKHEDRIVHQLRDVSFAVDRIERHVVGIIQHRFRTLKDPYGGLSAFGSATEKQNCLSERVGDRDFVMNSIDRYVVAGASL